MTGWPGVLLMVLLPAAALAAEPDVPGSRDPYGVPRVPRSWIVDYQQETEVRPREFVMSRVDRIRRELRIDDQLAVDATLEAVTYRMPDGVAVNQVVDHYADALGDDVLFRCTGRDCGRSNDWANQIFGQAILYGPDGNQRYVAREWQGRLVVLYAIERGNQRTYAHLRFLEPQGGAAVEPNALLARRLAERGWAVVESVTPTADGTLDEAERSVLSEVGGALGRFAGQPMFLVCHLYGRDGTDVLLAASRRCAETGVEAIAGGADDGAGGGTAGSRSGGAAPLDLTPYGAGPLLPRSSPPAPRLEIVLPARALRRGG